MWLSEADSYWKLWAEYDRLTGSGPMAQAFKQIFPKACELLSLAIMRFNLEAVRRGILPEQKIKEIEP